jgi:hypothetical protein
MNGLAAYKRHNRATGAVRMIVQSVADILGQAAPAAEIVAVIARSVVS